MFEDHGRDRKWKLRQKAFGHNIVDTLGARQVAVELGRQLTIETYGFGVQVRLFGSVR